ncbi:MAG: Gfo/Idh/MocA family oxidoreductase [Planctomycetia bacterium]|nr:Gfo/Idh/MocA family oxidoreductase [Planctomycetia bacterium]
MPLHVDRRTFIQGGVAATISAASWNRVLGANDRIGVGFIGYGLIGKRHVLDFQEQSDADCVAVAEAHAGRMEEGRQMLGGTARAYRDFRSLLDDNRVDAVVISTPDHWHALQTMLACAAGKDVYVEKPLTLFVREGRWMVDVAKRHQRVVTVGTQQRSGAHYARARRLLEEGALGKISSVRMSAARNIMPGYGRPADSPPPVDLDWDTWQGPAPLHPYNPNRAIYHFRWFWDYSGGQMTNLGAHALDIVHWALGVDGPTAVSSSGGRFSLQDNGETPDTQEVMFEYPGFIATWSHRGACGSSTESIPLEFFGPRGRLALTRSSLVLTPDRKVIPVNTVPQFTDAHPVGGPQRVPDDGPREYWADAIEDKTGNARQQLKEHVRNFLDCVKSRQQPVSDLESGHRVATACHLANLSLRLGRKLKWDSAREEIPDDAEANRQLVRPYRAPWDRELRALGIG